MLTTMSETQTVTMPTKRQKLSKWLDNLLASGLVVFLLLLPFHLVFKRLFIDPWGSYWKEMLLGLLLVLWVGRNLLTRQFSLSLRALDGAVFGYVGLLLVRFLLDRSGWIGAWGLYVSVLYLPVFWIVKTLFEGRRDRLYRLLMLLIVIGGIVAAGGLVEFISDTPLWPSVELTQRQGFPDMYIYGTKIRRVYFTFDSPTTLGNTLASLLPLAVAGTLIFQSRWLKGLAGGAALLMVGCIIVTFSRGVWVATAIAFLALILGRGWRQSTRGWGKFTQTILLLVAPLILLGLAWGGVTLFLIGDQASPESEHGLVELSPAGYAAIPIFEVQETLLQNIPAYGTAVTQTWTLLDAIAGNVDRREVLYQHPPETGKTELIYHIAVPQSGALRFAITLSPDVWSPEKGDGASFQMYVLDPTTEQGQFIFVRYINPKHNPSDRRWRNFLIDLSPWAGQEIALSLITESGPVGDWAYDWAGWADLQVITTPASIFVAPQTENAVLRHTASIFDWTTDETNRDRLMAWSMGWHKWRESLFWGAGLGTTGVAGLRTQPAQAFVTESQVLKSLVELGLPGFLMLAYLWFQIARAGYRTYKFTQDPAQRWLLLALLTSLLIIFIEGWVYQNLEVKQVNAYFWTLVGLLAVLESQG